METRANYVLIGAFTLLGVLGSLAFFLWLAKVQVDRQYAYYDILFESVSGLGEAGDVRYNGLPVGQVVSLGLDDADPSKVRVRIEVAAQTPIKTDTVAKLESQGVTGVSYVGLSGGGPDSPLLRSTSAGKVPVIASEKSAFQSIFDGAPELLNKAIALLEDINDVVSPENKAAVTTILSNLSSASGQLDTVLKDFSGLSGDLSLAAREIAEFTSTLEGVAGTANVTLVTAGETLTTAKEAIERAHATIDNATEALASARDAFTGANVLIADQLPKAIEQVNATAGTIQTVVAEVGGKAGAAIDGANAAIGKAGATADKFAALGDVAIARLTEAEATLAALDAALIQADATMKAIQSASSNVDQLVAGEGAALVASARTAVDNANGLITGRIPALIDRADGTLGAVQQTVTDVGARIDTLAEVATARLIEAEGTLTQANLTLIAVQAASASVAELAQGDGAALVKEAREAMTTVNAAVQSAARVIEEDVPLIVADVRAATARARELFTNFDGEVSGLTGRFDGLTTLAETALTTATDTFANANKTLAAVTGAIDQAEATLASAEKTFNGVNRVLDEDIDQILADARTTMAALEKAVTETAGDLPLITQDVRRTLASAENFVNNLDAILTQNSGQIDAFMRAGLPQFVRFTQEARSLVQNLQRVTQKIERDPARFILGTQSPEFRR